MSIILRRSVYWRKKRWHIFTMLFRWASSHPLVLFHCFRVTSDFILDCTCNLLQTDLKRLVRNPPLVKIPKIRDLISTNPLLGALPPTVCERLIGSTKEIMKLRGATLYGEGSKPTGVWLISNGVVKVISSVTVVTIILFSQKHFWKYDVLFDSGQVRVQGISLYCIQLSHMGVR